MGGREGGGGVRANLGQVSKQVCVKTFIIRKREEALLGDEALHLFESHAEGVALRSNALESPGGLDIQTLELGELWRGEVGDVAKELSGPAGLEEDAKREEAALAGEKECVEECRRQERSDVF